MSDKLKSRKLWVFIALVALVAVNFIFKLGMPSEDVFYLVLLGASYILGQGYVDAKKQPVQGFPAEDVSTAVTNIIQAELTKTGFGKNLPIEDILNMFKAVMRQELGKLNITLVPAPEDEALAPNKISLAGDTSTTTPQ